MGLMLTKRQAQDLRGVASLMKRGEVDRAAQRLEEFIERNDYVYKPSFRRAEPQPESTYV